MTLNQFTKHLTKITSFIFSPAPLREPTPPRDPTPPKDESKWKGIATEEPLKDIMPFMEEGCSVPKILSFKSFVIPEGRLTNEEVMAQVKEMKRLDDLKVEKEKYENISERRRIPLATTTQLIRLQGVIQRGTPEAEEMFKKMEMAIEARNDTSAGIEGLAKCKASASNLRRIHVKDIVKEVEDHLKTYSSAVIDISWYVEGIRCGSKESQRWQYSDYPVTL
ncbi:hypothetical protein Tco_0541480 [Tanacetum coccineum]